MQRSGELPPHDISAEEAVVAAMLLDEEAYSRVGATLEPQDFFREHNGWIFAAARALDVRRERITLQTLAHELDLMGKLDAAGGEPYLIDVAGRYFTAVGVEAHARIVARTAFYRRLIAAAQQITHVAYSAPPDEQRVASVVTEMLEGIVGGYSARLAGQRGPVAMYDDPRYSGELARL